MKKESTRCKTKKPKSSTTTCKIKIYSKPISLKKEIINKNANNTIDTTTNIIIETLIESFLKATDEYCDNTNSFHKTDDIPNSPPSSTQESGNYRSDSIHRAFVFKRFRPGGTSRFTYFTLQKKNWDKVLFYTIHATFVEESDRG